MRGNDGGTGGNDVRGEMTTAYQHTETSERFLEQAEAEFAAGDLLQASEKAWGAVARYVKAVAEHNGWPHYSHSHIRRNANRLFRLVDDRAVLEDKFTHVERLHVNFYESDLERHQVRRYMDDAREVLETLKRIAPISTP